MDKNHLGMWSLQHNIPANIALKLSSKLELDYFVRELKILIKYWYFAHTYVTVLPCNSLPIFWKRSVGEYKEINCHKKCTGVNH